MKKVSLALLALAACGDDPTATAPDAGADAAAAADAAPALVVPDTYTFASRYAMPSSVAYTGQASRHLLIAELNAYIAGLTTAIDSGEAPAAGEVRSALDFYYRYDATTGGDVAPRLSTTPALAQKRLGDLISAGTNLELKVAGAEAAHDHRDWATSFEGWGAAGSTTPRQLVRAWFDELDALAAARGRGEIPEGPDGKAITRVHVTPEGRDLKELIQKFLLVSVGWSQGADKYLDSATDGAGLRSPNTRDGTAAYTRLEHAWDEGFGYFGAARAYKLRSDAQNNAPGYHDADGDGAIDLRAELNFGQSVNAARRDLDARTPTDFSGQAIDAFLRGRAIIAAAPEGATLPAATLAALEAQRDLAVAAWEKAIAATIVHYLNQVLRHHARFGTAEYVFVDHAKHWSEAKGFALGLQFNPRSLLTLEQLRRLHQLLGDAPVLPDADAGAIAAYRQGLVEARGILGTTFGFDTANMGTLEGEGGW